MRYEKCTIEKIINGTHNASYKIVLCIPSSTRNFLNQRLLVEQSKFTGTSKHPSTVKLLPIIRYSIFKETSNESVNFFCDSKITGVNFLFAHQIPRAWCWWIHQTIGRNFFLFSFRPDGWNRLRTENNMKKQVQRALRNNFLRKTPSASLSLRLK